MFFSSTAAFFFGSVETALLSPDVTGCIRVTSNKGLAGYRFTLARTSETVASIASKDRFDQALVTTRLQLDSSG
jgi:hypothetical protein